MIARISGYIHIRPIFLPLVHIQLEYRRKLDGFGFLYHDLHKCLRICFLYVSVHKYWLSVAHYRVLPSYIIPRSYNCSRLKKWWSCNSFDWTIRNTPFRSYGPFLLIGGGDLVSEFSNWSVKQQYVILCSMFLLSTKLHSYPVVTLYEQMHKDHDKISQDHSIVYSPWWKLYSEQYQFSQFAMFIYIFLKVTGWHL